MQLDLNRYHPAPRRPGFVAPAGAVDAHCHVFGPADVFPYSATRKYTPGDAPKEALFALRDHLGFERNVIVQASCHGTENAAMVDALLAAGDRARGIAVVPAGVTDDALAMLQAAGVRGVRFNFLRRLVDATPRAHYERILEKIVPLGWHVVIYFEAPELPELAPFIAALPTTVVIDHMGRPDVDLGIEHAQWRRFLDLMDAHPNIWVKVSGAERLSKTGSPYDDVVPFGRELVERYSDRVLWGTDWPHPNMETHVPDDGLLVDFIPRIATTAALQRKLLVDNPMRLYWARSAMPDSDPFDDIPGTTLFDAQRSRQGYHLNMFCMSLMSALNRAAFKADERAYLETFPMTLEQRDAVLARHWNRMLELGGNIYYTSKLGATDGLSFQHLAAKMTGSTQEDYARMMLAGGRSVEGNRSKRVENRG